MLILLGFAVLVLLLVWLEWIWWGTLFGPSLDKYYLILVVVSGLVGRLLFTKGSSWPAMVAAGICFLVSLTALVVGIYRQVQRARGPM